ncbi:amino acid adenylation domain-containing protein [Streptomyces sp. NPDC059009]|uniref:amino acid adenylation domain-containing protein n=1 Tax=Streptomyces sp. NPDC059009 TaxID=3346694 RepID=UPI0036A0A613
MQPNVTPGPRTAADGAWTAGEPCTAPSEGLHETLSRTARRRPAAVALIEGERTTTYGELDSTADAWAARLAALGAGPGRLVPVLLPRGTDLVVALLAVLKTGAAYALLDPSWPERRLADVRADLDPPLLIAANADTSDTSDTSDAPQLPLGGAPLPVFVPPRTPVAAPSGFRPVAVDGSAPACVFFTSGTTGRPKGVLTPHRATARLFPRGTGGFAEFTAETVMPLAAPLPWDAFSLELWSVLLNGGTSLIQTEPYLSPAALRTGVSRHGMDTVWLTSSLFNMIVDEDPGAFRGLRQVLIGGERLSVAHVRRFLGRHPDIMLLNGYGPVESTVFTTTHRVTAADCARPGGIPLGHPVPGTRVHVLEPGGTRPCGVGETGELCVAGEGLALGYLGASALTDEKFTLVPAGAAGTPERVYRTGDLVEWDADGLLHFRGRADRQVKIRGHRVEPAEVERQVEEVLPRVRSCRVLARPDASGTEQELVAFCRPSRPGDPLADALGVLRAALVAYQRPALVVSVDDFPVTAQGKLDERALLARAAGAGRTSSSSGAADSGAAGTGAAAADTGAAARTGEDGPADGGGPANGGGLADSGGRTNRGGLAVGPEVRAVADAFAAVLGHPSVPLDVPFAELGGTSLGAGRVCARLAARLGRPVPVSRLYRHPTAVALADWLRTVEAEEAGAEPQPVAPGPAEPTPLTPLQTVYLTRQLVAPADRTAHCLVTWVIDGPLDRAALRTAVRAVHERHEALRAAYVPDPRPSAVPVDLPAPGLEVLPGAPSVDAAVRALRAELTDELDLLLGEVWRTALVPVGAGDTAVFGCVVHHIAFDGCSESVLAHDLATAYAAAAGAAAPVPPAGPPPGLAAQHAERVRRLRLTEADAAHDAYVAELTGVPELRWPLPPGEPVSVADQLEIKVPPSAVAGVDGLAGAAGVTRFAALLALWGAGLAEVTGQRDFAVGVPVSQRDGAGLGQVVGCHIGMLCLRLREAALAGGAAGAAAAGRVTERAFQAQDLPLTDLLTLVDPPRTGRHPVYQTLFALQDNPAPELDLPGLRTRFVRQPYAQLPLELHTECWPQSDGGLRVEFAFRAEAVPEAAVRELAERFTDRLRALAGDCPGGALAAAGRGRQTAVTAGG